MKEIIGRLWEVTHELRMPGGIYFNTRMSIVDIGDGELVLHSPVPINDDLAREIERVGEVRWIVAPNDMHHLFLASAAERYPEAAVWGTRGVREKQQDVTFSGSLEDGVPEEWDNRVEALSIPGTRGWGETVFFLPESRTLLCTDLVFNIHETVNLRTKWLLKLVGAHGKLAQSASVRWWFTRDRDAVGDAFARILDWNFDKLVMGHGHIVEKNGRALVAPLLQWALADERQALPA